MSWQWNSSTISDGKIDVSSSGPELTRLVTRYRVSLFRQSRGYLLLHGTEYPKTTGADFTLEELLGRGVFGDVFLVLHEPTRRRMAIKEFRKPLGPACVAKTIENIQTLAHFRSPYVTQILGVIWNERCFFLCQEYVERRSLNSLLQRCTPWEEVIGAVAYQIIRGMAFLDDNGLKHREIKPSNVLFGGDGRVLLADFSLCQHLTDCISNTQIDSIDHMAPERVLAADATHADERSDVWTLGSLIYLMVKGHAVYPRERYGGMYQLVVACSTGTPPELSLLDFSPSCRDFLQQCLRRNPNERATFQTLLEHPFVTPYRTDPSLGSKIIADFLRR